MNIEQGKYFIIDCDPGADGIFKLLLLIFLDMHALMAAYQLA